MDLAWRSSACRHCSDQHFSQVQIQAGEEKAENTNLILETHRHKPCITHSIKSKKAFSVLFLGFFLVAGIQRENSHLLLVTIHISKKPCYKKEKEIKSSFYRESFQRMSKQ